MLRGHVCQLLSAQWVNNFKDTKIYRAVLILPHPGAFGFEIAFQKLHRVSNMSLGTQENTLKHRRTRDFIAPLFTLQTIDEIEV